MKLIFSKMAILTIAASCAFSPAAYAQNISDGAAYANRNCTWCHGNSAQGFAIAPQLAGQRPEYILRQLANFKDKTRNNPYSARYMSHVAVKVGPEAAVDVAHYFSSLPVKAASNGDEDRAGKGKAIFQSGIPSENIVACSFCHGPDAQGVGTIPRLGGQSYNYLKRRLEQWNEGYYQSAEHMPGVANSLSPSQIEALSSYLSFVK
jgi:cytochrome c553